VHKYVALNAQDAPVVRLLDCYRRDGERYLVLDRAEPLSLDTRHPTDFEEVIRWSLEFSATRDPSYPSCDVAYFERYWRATTGLIEYAGNVRSSLYAPQIVDCPAPTAILEAFLRALQGDACAIVHGDPADFNLGTVKGRIVAFDLGLSCTGNPLTNLALRTGAFVAAFPQHTDVPALVERYVGQLGLQVEAPFELYLLAGAVYGSYFEQGALDQIRAGKAGDAVLHWARLALQR
jgi:hypothetical protein